MSDVVVLLGAGASRDADLPDVKQLVQTFLDRTEFDNIGLARSIYERLATVEPIVDVEHLLSALDQLEQRTKQPLSAFTKSDGWRDEALYPSTAYSTLRNDVYRHIRETLHLERDDARYYDHICDLAAIHDGIDVFSLNYDLAVELACLNTGTTFTDGFDPAWNPELFENHARFQVRLHKLHGSLLWHRLESGFVEKVAVSPKRTPSVHHYSGSTLSEALVYPAAAGKDVHTDPYATLVERFRMSLREASVLIVIGYSFRDAHIKSIVTEAIATRPELRMVVVDIYPTEMLSTSDELAPSQFVFRNLSAQIHPLPLAAAEALSTHEVRESVPRAKSIETLRRSGDDIKRRHNQSDVLTHTGEMVRESLIHRWGYYLAECALGNANDDYSHARGWYLGRNLTNAEHAGYDELAQLLLVSSALVSCPDEDVATQARAFLRDLMHFLCRGVVFKAPGKSAEPIFSHILHEEVPERVAIDVFWRQRLSILELVLNEFHILNKYTSYHLSELGELCSTMMEGIITDLEYGVSFFETCLAGNPVTRDALPAVVKVTGATRYRAYTHPDASQLMETIGEAWSGERFPTALSGLT